MCHAKDILVAIPRPDWPALRDLYRRDWPLHFVGFQTIDALISWTKLHPAIGHLQVYALNGDWSDGTFVVAYRFHLLINTLNPSIDRLTKAVALMNWSHGLCDSTFLSRHRAAVDNLRTSHQLTNCALEMALQLYYIPHEKAAAVEVICPSGVTLGPLRVEHAERITDLWPYGDGGTLLMIRHYILLSLNVGAFDTQGKLLAWCLRSPVGQLCMLHVEDTHRMQGLGELVCRAMTRQLGRSGVDVSANVTVANKASNLIFRGIGFRVVDHVDWLRLKALKKDTTCID